MLMPRLLPTFDMFSQYIQGISVPDSAARHRYCSASAIFSCRSSRPRDMGANVAASWQQVVKLLQDCSTRHADSAGTLAALRSVHGLIRKLKELPTPPKAVWKKLVQLQVPLKLGATFTAAAQRDWKSPAANLAMLALDTLLRKACDASIASNTSSSSLGSSMRQQLQQSGVLQQLSAGMTTMTAELQAGTAVLESEGFEAARGKVMQLVLANDVLSRFDAYASCRHLLWGFWADQAASAGWMWGPSGHAVAVMQFATAGLQHVSSIGLHMLPALRREAPQLVPQYVQTSQSSSKLAWEMCMDAIIRARAQSPPPQQQGQRSEIGAWQQLLLSPHLLPCLAAVVVMVTSHMGRASTTQCAQVGGSSSSSGSSSGSSKEASSSRTTGPLGQERLFTPGSITNSCSGSSSSEAVSATFTPHQQQLMQLVGVTSEVADWVLQPESHSTCFIALSVALNACYDCCAASQQLLHSSSSSSSSLGSGVSEEQQQRWQYEKQLWRLLPMLLVPCASSLLLPRPPVLASTPQPAQARLAKPPSEGELIDLLLLLSQMLLSCQLQAQLQTLGSPSETPATLWIDEMLDALLQLADRLLYQQPSTAPVTAAAAAVNTGATSTSTSTSHSTSQQAMQAAKILLLLLSLVAKESRALGFSDSSDSSNRCEGSAASAVSAVATRLVEVATALEAAVRAVAAEVQSSTLSTVIEGLASDNLYVSLALLPLNEQNACMHATYLLLQHMGLQGPEALAQELRQLYSLLSTVQKLHYCVQPEAQRDWQEEIAAGCCLAAGHTAVGLLEVTLAAGAGVSNADQQLQSTPAAAAAAQQPAESYLPSLVIFGRCLLQWAEQLQQQWPELLLLEAGELQQNMEQDPEALLYEYSAACVCIPGLQEGSASTPGQDLESLAATVFEWVGSISSPAAHAQLAAAGCPPPQLQQQLDALLSAQQATQQGLTDASFAALVQELQTTGAMLSSIAVPHFCNNPACAKFSGSTEVRSVSRCSCLCAACRTARYCCRACQCAAWKQHKPVCKALVAAAAAAATANSADSGS